MVWDMESIICNALGERSLSKAVGCKFLITADMYALLCRTPEADRANQGEIGALVGATDWLSWEHEPELHYHDLGPDGRQTRLRDSLVLVPGVKKRPNPYCAFCGGPSGGAREAQVDGKKVDCSHCFVPVLPDDITSEWCELG